MSALYVAPSLALVCCHWALMVTDDVLLQIGTSNMTLLLVPMLVTRISTGAYGILYQIHARHRVGITVQ